MNKRIEGIVLILFSSLLVCTLSQGLSLHLFPNAKSRNAVCNDGTPAGFYFRAGSGSGSNTWVVHLQGGFWCWNNDTCSTRSIQSPYYVSSRNWSETLDVGGLFSTSQSNNPYFYNANMVYVAYCSSDAWSGDRLPLSRKQYITDDWYFQGSSIIAAVFQDLQKYFGMVVENSDILFSGCSAGGQGVIVNVDYVNSLVGKKAKKFKALADAGWMMDIQPLNSTGNTAVSQQFQEGIVLWQGNPNQSCQKGNPTNSWMCYFSTFALPYIESQILIQTNQFDSFQVPWDCCSLPFSSSDMTTVSTIQTAFRTSLSHLIRTPNAAFSAACFDHCLTESSQFNGVMINEVSLAVLLGEWWENRANTTALIDLCEGVNCSQGC
eukprot:TRINITY_DN6272_c0_g1_i2.p1 TRINITY_DN6272_c0_g1~~TRINITY_DN6272_c0_g1_i2.p1  ORF type:complete len:378 (-),score=57.56 TRINITY_DN6272_c0_g1_i2:145-1278(-)